MQKLIVRAIEGAFLEEIKKYPVVSVLGPKQSGKTTFINMISNRVGEMRYFNLKKQEHLETLYEAETIFKTSKKVVFIIDNIHLAPELLSVIGSLIHSGATRTHFIVVSVMAMEQLQQSLSAFTRSCIFPLSGLSLSELFHPLDFSIARHWLRGGFPDSYFATSDTTSAVWRENYLKQLIENDNFKLGIYLSGMQMHRLLNIFAQSQSESLHASKTAEIFHITHPTIRRYVEMLERSYFMRLLLPYPEKTKKRIVKSPKIYIRDSGMLHKLLSISDMEALRNHPLRLASWKGYVIENIRTGFPDWESFFYESVSGPCLDLVMIRGKQKIAIKIALSIADITDNYQTAINDVQPNCTYIVSAASPAQWKETKNIVPCILPELMEYVRKTGI
jgi:predicted AAA+ superfamily ATPase